MPDTFSQKTAGPADVKMTFKPTSHIKERGTGQHENRKTDDRPPPEVTFKPSNGDAEPDDREREEISRSPKESDKNET